MAGGTDRAARLARQLEARLAPYAPVGRIAPSTARPPSRRRRVVGAAIAAVLAATVVGLGYGINASAESQGLGCLHPIAKVQLYAEGIAGSVRDADHHAANDGARQQHDARDSHQACHP